jgi:hypothetical protein
MRRNNQIHAIIVTYDCKDVTIGDTKYLDKLVNVSWQPFRSTINYILVEIAI